MWYNNPHLIRDDVDTLRDDRFERVAGAFLTGSLSSEWYCASAAAVVDLMEMNSLAAVEVAAELQDYHQLLLLFPA